MVVYVGMCAFAFLSECADSVMGVSVVCLSVVLGFDFLFGCDDDLCVRFVSGSVTVDSIPIVVLVGVGWITGEGSSVGMIPGVSVCVCICTGCMCSGVCVAVVCSCMSVCSGAGVVSDVCV